MSQRSNKAPNRGSSYGDRINKPTPQSPLHRIRNAVSRTPAAHPDGFPRKRSSSAPPRLRHLHIEDHYRVDPKEKFLLPGLPVNDDDWARDLHDFFNLVCLVPVVVLNVMNWNWDILLDPNSKKTIQQAWTSEWFSPFFAVVIGYFIIDLIWVTVVPKCVKSPAVIIQHHIVTLLYLIIPYRFPQDEWLMGACLSVEINTWFLIARRVFNKQGFPPWVINLPHLVSIRIKLISILFYATWFPIRCGLYPAILLVLGNCWKAEGFSLTSHYLITFVLHSVFCVLNFKWTFDLFRSKFRAWKRGTSSKVDKGL